MKDLHTHTVNHKNAGNYVTIAESTKIDGARYANGLSIKNNVILGPGSRVDGIDLSEELVSENGHSKLGKYFNPFDYEKRFLYQTLIMLLANIDILKQVSLL